MDPEWFADVRPHVKSGVRVLVDELPDDRSELPTRTFHDLSSAPFIDNTTEFQVPVPGELVDRTTDFRGPEIEGFERAAEIIVQQLPDPKADKSDPKEERKEAVESELVEFAETVLNYTGECRFDNDAFDAAFEEQFEPRFSDRVRSRFLLRLKNLGIDPDLSIELDTAIQGRPDYLGPYSVETLRIRALDELEETGIATHEAPSTDILEPVESLSANRPNPAVEIVLRRRRPLRDIARDIDGTELSPWASPDYSITPAGVYPWQQFTEIIDHVATRVRRCLRLECAAGNPGIEKGYHAAPGWQTYRGIAANVAFEIDFDCRPSSLRTNLREERAERIQRVWSDHSDRFRPDDSTFQSPFSRFERMFSRESDEDQLVDCAVGCETTLLKGGTRGGNKYRVGLRAGVLLSENNSKDWSAARVAEFFRTVYEHRSSIVHDDGFLPDDPGSGDRIEFDDRTVLADTFLRDARQLYSDVLLSYLELTDSGDLSIDQVNEQLDEAVLEQAADVYERLADE